LFTTRAPCRKVIFALMDIAPSRSARARQPGKLQARPGEWDARDGHSKQDSCDQVTERQSPTGEQQPHNVADHP
jgi:hypothetical protein